jgi:hypothetical protein
MALIAVAADKGSPGVTTAAIALAAVWPRPVLLAECDPAGGDLVYRLPGADGEPLDPRRGLLSLAVAARRGLQPRQVWEHTQQLHGGLDVLTGVTNAEQGAGLDALWASLGTALGAFPQADVIADCGRIGADGPYYDLLAQASTVVMITRASLGEVVRLRDRAGALLAGVQRRGRPGTRVGVVVIAQHKRFDSTLTEVRNALGHDTGPVSVVGGLAFEPRSADQLSGQWGGRLDRSMLIRTTRQIAGQLAAQLPDLSVPGIAAAASSSANRRVPKAGPAAAPPAVPAAVPPAVPAAVPSAAQRGQQVTPPPLPDQTTARLAPLARRGRHAEPAAAPAAWPDPVREGYADVSPGSWPDPQPDDGVAVPLPALPDRRADAAGPDDGVAVPPAGLPDPLRNGHADLPPGSLLPLPGQPGPDRGW